MSVQKAAYLKYVEKSAKKSPLVLDCAKAFFVGGSICMIGQVLKNLYTNVGLSEETVKALVPSSIVLLTALLTAIGLFDQLAKFGGAGTLVPISGFANAVVAPAIDNKAEGWVLGLGAKIFIIAGPVILYGTLASVIYGVVYWVMGLL
ncbi:MAG: SpoVA/SpoVAEb family sporulation membrane protein [Clostridia bacterium]|nr:SpoVA/SpoVAEb family sporulation membrane protein [Clostridia bacterium]